jgi:hypothetical protein
LTHAKDDSAGKGRGRGAIGEVHVRAWQEMYRGHIACPTNDVVSLDALEVRGAVWGRATRVRARSTRLGASLPTAPLKREVLCGFWLSQLRCQRVLD